MRTSARRINKKRYRVGNKWILEVSRSINPKNVMSIYKCVEDGLLKKNINLIAIPEGCKLTKLK